MILIALALLSLAGTAAAQSEDDAAVFSGIFRGKLPGTYPFKYNGTYFWDHKAFQKGTVWYNGKQYEDISLNVDAYMNELQVRPLENASAVVVYTDQVAWFTMGNTLFVNLQYLGWKEAPDGFFEVVRNGQKPLLRRVQKTLRFDANGNSWRSIGEDKEDYSPTIPNYFQLDESYYVLENGAVRKISSRTLKKMLKEPAGEPLLNVNSVRWRTVSESPVFGAVTTADLPGTGTGLPEGYFAEKQKDTTTVQYVDTPALATYRNKVYTIGDPAVDKGGALKSVHGNVTEAETGEPMYGVVVFDDITKSYTRTDRRGNYSINLPGGENVLNFSADGKEDLALRVMVQSDGGLNVMMTEKVTMLKEAVVSAESMAQHRNTEMGVEKVSVKTVFRRPSGKGTSSRRSSPSRASRASAKRPAASTSAAAAPTRTSSCSTAAPSTTPRTCSASSPLSTRTSYPTWSCTRARFRPNMAAACPPSSRWSPRTETCSSGRGPPASAS